MMSMNVRTFTVITTLLLLVLAVLSACKPDPAVPEMTDTPAASGDAAPVPVDTSTAQEPEQRSWEQSDGQPLPNSWDTIMIEGEPQPVKLARVAGDNLPYQTMYPVDDFVPQIASDERGTGAIFRFRFADTVRDDMYFHIFTPAELVTPHTLSIAAEEGLKSRDVVVTPADVSKFCPWAVQGARLTDKSGYQGWLCIGEHNGMAFYTIEFYPNELAETLPPRIDVIRNHLRWDDGEALVKGGGRRAEGGGRIE